MNNELLTEYQKCLRAKSLVQEKYITYYAHWARKFILAISCQRSAFS